MTVLLQWGDDEQIPLNKNCWLCFNEDTPFKTKSLNYRQRWQAPDVLAELAKESSARVYTRYVSSEILFGGGVGSKVKNLLGRFWLGIFVQDSLPVNLKQDV